MSREAKRQAEKSIKKADLAESINKLVEQVNQINNNIVVLDAGVFLALHSLIKEERIHHPKLNHTEDLVKTGVVAELEKIRKTLDEMSENDTARDGAEGGKE